MHQHDLSLLGWQAVDCISQLLQLFRGFCIRWRRDMLKNGRFDRRDAITTPLATSDPVSMLISSDTAEPTAEDFWLLSIPPTGLAIQVGFRNAILSDFCRIGPRRPPRSNEPKKRTAVDIDEL